MASRERERPEEAAQVSLSPVALDTQEERSLKTISGCLHERSESIMGLNEWLSFEPACRTC
jgi:hypothetical protein